MEEIYHRIAQSFDLDPKNINLLGRLCPEENKYRNLSPDIIMKDEKHLVTYLKVEISKVNQNNLNKRVSGNDIGGLKAIEIENKIYYFNKFLSIRIIKKMLTFKWEINNQCLEFYDTDSGTNYLDNA
jgi:hypothetical protein